MNRKLIEYRLICSETFTRKRFFSSWLLFFLLVGPLAAYGQMIQIMPLGNSITHGEHGSTPIGGYRDDLANMLLTEGTNFNFVGTLHDGTTFYPWHEGHPGWSADWIKNFVADYVTWTEPEIVMIHLGTNDFAQNFSADQIRHHLETIIDRIHAVNPQIIILLATIIPKKEDTLGEHDALNRRIWLLVQEKLDEGLPIYYCGVNALFKTNPGWEYSYMFDTLHPNNDGYNVIARVFYKSLMNVMSSTGTFITDNFNRSQLVGCWSSQGGYTIDNNQFLNNDTNSGKFIAVYRTENSPISVSITYGQDTDPARSGEIGLALRLETNSKTTNGYTIWKESATGDLVLSLVSNGAVNYEVDRVSGIYGAPAAGDTLKVVMHDDGRGHFFDCFLNGGFDGRLVDSQVLAGNYGYLHAGVISIGTANHRLDDFNLSFEDEPAFDGPTQLVATNGNPQEEVVNTLATDPLEIQVQNPDGDGVAGIAVDYEFQEGSGAVFARTADGKIGIELENALLVEPMVRVEAADASAGEYIVAPTGSVPNTGLAEAAFYVLEAGNFRIWGRAFAPDAAHNSFGITIDDGAEMNWQIDSPGSWQWDQVGDLGAEDPKTIALGQGLHAIKVVGKTTDVRLDRFILTKNLSFSPEATKQGSSEFYTDANGKARAYAILPKVAGNISIAASLPEYSVPDVTFDLTAIPDDPSDLQIVSGNNQFGTPNNALGLPLKISLHDQYGNIAGDVAIMFDVVQGGGSLLESMPLYTDESGEAEAHLVLGPDPGTNAVMVSAPATSANTVLFQATAEKMLFAISGFVRYYADDDPVSGVKMAVSGGFSAQDTTNMQGAYRLSSIPKNTDFQVVPSKIAHTAGNPNLITMYDAALIMRHYMKLEMLTPKQEIAADVDRNAQIWPYDAVHVARFALKLPPIQNSQVGKWIFNPGNGSYSNITVDKENENYQAYLLGDVKGGWNASSQPKQIADSYQWNKSSVAVTGDTICVPFDIDQSGFLSCELLFEISEQDVALLDIRKTALSEDFAVFYKSEARTLHLGLFSAYPAGEVGEFLQIRFKALKETLSEESIVFQKYRFDMQPFRLVTAIFPVQASGEAPKSFALYQNFPNPFNPETVIRYQLAKSAKVNITIYNILGQRVRMLVDKNQEAGQFEVKWDGKDYKGNQTSGGVYIYRLVADDHIITKKMLKSN